MAFRGEGSRSKGKKRRIIEDGEEEYADDQPSCSICHSTDPGKIIHCGFCRSSSHGWCVNLRGKDFLAEGRHAWFEKYACPDCTEKGKRSTRSRRSIGLTSSTKSGYSDLHECAKALWSKVLETSETPPHVELICNMAMMSVRNLEDGQLESNRELLDLIVGTLHYVMVPMGEAQLLKLFDFNTTLALRFLEASTEDMQLWGWNQMGAILALTQRHCRGPKEVSVVGAGSEGIDGLYRVSPNDEKKVRETAYFVSSKTLASSMPPQQRNPPTYIQKGGRGVLSLSNNFAGKNMWEISRLDPSRRRATTKTRYYSFQAPLPAENMVRPCGSGWRQAVDGLEDLHPPPVVMPVTKEGYLCPKGKEKETLEWQLANWMIRNKVVNKLFDNPTELVVVNGSIELLKFMARMEETLTRDHVSLIWRSGERGPEFQTATNNVLSRLILDVRPELVVHLFERLQEGVGGKSDEWGGWNDVLEFLAQVARNPGHRILGRFEEVQTATAELVWSLLEKPQVLRHNSCELVSTLLTSVVYTSKKAINDREDLQRFLERCISSWRTSSELQDYVSTVRHMLDKFELKHIRQFARLFDTSHGHEEVGASPQPDNTDATNGEANSQPEEPRETFVNVKEEGVEAVRFPESLRQAMCGICGDADLLDNAGTDMFGVMSWRCRCAIRPLAHSRCIFTLKEKTGRRRTPCPFCRKDMSFGKAMKSYAQWLSLQVHNPPDVDAKLTDDEYDPPSEADDNQNDPDYNPLKFSVYW